jgi:hypothetical protein
VAPLRDPIRFPRDMKKGETRAVDFLKSSFHTRHGLNVVHKRKHRKIHGLEKRLRRFSVVVVPDFTYDTLESLHVDYGSSGFFLLFRAILCNDIIWAGRESCRITIRGYHRQKIIDHTTSFQSYHR